MQQGIRQQPSQHLWDGKKKITITIINKHNDVVWWEKKCFTRSRHKGLNGEGQKGRGKPAQSKGEPPGKSWMCMKSVTGCKFKYYENAHHK